ncbi:MAG TPA: lysyl oxidase family protein [Gaiellaceae bacterium]|nr:lysyl oxidase family protein [Gaiellaceae bacterium]
MNRTSLVAVVGLVGLLSIVVVAVAAPSPGAPAELSANLPDLRTVVPRHVQLVNQQQRDVLRFSNGIANTGGGPWALRPEHTLGGAPKTTAIQEIRSSGALYRCGTEPKQVKECYTVLAEHPATTFEYHPTHNHWHTGQVALFEIRTGSPSGPLAAGQSFKTGFCLIDLVRLDGNAPSSEKVFWDCETSFQGISAGWIDQYHQSTDGQQLDLTDVEDRDDLYLVSTSNPDGVFLEQRSDNNTAWQRFALTGKGTGNRKLTLLEHSPCESPALCGEFTANRG